MYGYNGLSPSLLQKGLKSIVVGFLLSLSTQQAIAQTIDNQDGYAPVPDSLREQALKIVDNSMYIDGDVAEHYGILFQAVRDGKISPGRKIFIDYAQEGDTHKVHVIGFASSSYSASLQLLFCPKTGLLLYKSYINDVLQIDSPQAIPSIEAFMNNSGILQQNGQKPSQKVKVYRI